MWKRNIPFALAQDIFEIGADYYKALGVTTLLVDLDMTLDPNSVKTPSERTLAWSKAMGDEGIRIVILSNNSGTRVHTYADLLGVECRCFMRKPFAGPLKAFLKEEGLSPEECILIGDQIQTDVLAGNGAGVRVILTEPLGGKEPPWTKFNRLFDRPKRKKIRAKGLAPHWRDTVK